ncbi:MAG: methylglyoxal synthase [Nitriliruptor sp.]|nr:MAG: methylglyoxal synthase [Nitriliruptor sp.]
MAPQPPLRTIALVAHDGQKADLLAWVRHNREVLAGHRLVATGTTGQLLADELGLEVLPLESGPLGGDMQLGAMITEGSVDALVFLWDPLSAQPHEPDVRALLRVATLWNVPVASNRATADLLVTSPLLTDPAYVRQVPDHAAHRERLLSQR